LDAFGVDTPGERAHCPKPLWRPTMLADSPIRPILLATDLEAAREFYHHKLGLPILLEREGAIEFKCGGDTRLAVSKSTTGTADSQTQVAWSVSDLEATLAGLRDNGVKIEDYDLPGLKTQDGIADVGFGRMAWIVDPGGNCLGIVQERQ
jgi:predicted enzyme related to lactoylglutathione lyase